MILGNLLLFLLKTEYVIEKKTFADPILCVVFPFYYTNKINYLLKSVLSKNCLNMLRKSRKMFVQKLIFSTNLPVNILMSAPFSIHPPSHPHRITTKQLLPQPIYIHSCL